MTFKNSSTITDVEYKCEEIVFIFSDGNKLVIDAVADSYCSSNSFFEEKSGYEFKSLIGQKIVSLHEELSDYKEIHTEYKDLRQIKSYKLKLESGKDFIFFLINDSNGEDTCWIEINFTQSDTESQSDTETELDY